MKNLVTILFLLILIAGCEDRKKLIKEQMEKGEFQIPPEIKVMREKDCAYIKFHTEECMKAEDYSKCMNSKMNGEYRPEKERFCQ